MPYTAPLHKPPVNSYRKLVFTIGGILFISICILIFTVWAKSSSKASINDNQGNESAAQTVGSKMYSGTYITFMYNGGYLLTTHVAKLPDLESATLTADTSYDKQITVAVQPLSSKGLDANGDYEFRKVYTSLYSERQLPAGGDTAIVWVKRDGTEQTAFIPNGNKVAVISLSTSGTNNPGDLQAEMNQILGSFHWK